jgi:hypothetical protein
MSTRLRFIATVLCLAGLGLAGLVVAQGQPRARQRANASRGRMNEGNPEATRQQMMQRIQQQLGASDTEWQVIQPRLQKVMELSRQTNRRGAGRMQGRPGGQRGQGGTEARPGGRRGAGQQTQGPRGQTRRPRDDANREPSPVQKASEELRTLLGDASASPEQVKAKLAALRQVRETAQQHLAQARSELQQVLAVKQEARLVLMGLLE